LASMLLIRVRVAGWARPPSSCSTIWIESVEPVRLVLAEDVDDSLRIGARQGVVVAIVVSHEGRAHRHGGQRQDPQKHGRTACRVDQPATRCSRPPRRGPACSGSCSGPGRRADVSTVISTPRKDLTRLHVADLHIVCRR
jgi:hypothetical protein